LAEKKKHMHPIQNSSSAALLLDNGQTVLGSNQENAAYPSGLCAERVAIFQAAIYPEAKF
jgi:cytidine deaminase